MKRYEILITDFDGTLLKDDRTISKETVNAIIDFEKRGGKFVINTGRTKSAIDKIICEYGIKPLLLSANGAEFSNLQTGETLFNKSIPSVLAYEFVKFVENLGLYVFYYPENNFVVAYGNVRSDRYQVNGKIECEIHNPVSEYIKFCEKSTPKLLVFDDKEKLDKHFLTIKNKFQNLEVIRSNDFQIDVNLKGVSKGTGVKEVAKYFGLTENEVIGVGDAGNDIPMLEVVGMPIAVQNAQENVKSICKKTVPSNNDDGIKFIIENYCI